VPGDARIAFPVPSSLAAGTAIAALAMSMTALSDVMGTTLTKGRLAGCRRRCEGLLPRRVVCDGGTGCSAHAMDFACVGKLAHCWCAGGAVPSSSSSAAGLLDGEGRTFLRAAPGCLRRLSASAQSLRAHLTVRRPTSVGRKGT